MPAKGTRSKGAVKGPRTKRGVAPRTGEYAPVNIKHELFAHEYLVDFDAGAAYLRAGYEVKDAQVAQVCGLGLLKNTKVWAIVEAFHLKRIEAAKLDAEKTVLRLQFCYEEAAKDRDWKSAISALKELGKHFGIYKANNDQKRHGPQDVERLKQELEAAGWNYGRTNFPVPPSSDN